MHAFDFSDTELTLLINMKGQFLHHCIICCAIALSSVVCDIENGLALQNAAFGGTINSQHNMANQ